MAARGRPRSPTSLRRCGGALADRSRARPPRGGGRYHARAGALPEAEARADDVLAGRLRYDHVDEAAGALVRAAWQMRIDERLASRDHLDALVAAGATWAEADECGGLVIRHPGDRR